MFPAVFNVNSLNGTNGFIINGVTPSDGSGSGVERAGDINGDGLDDVIIQAPYSGGVGQNYVVFGNKNGFPLQFNLSSLNGENGFVIADNIINGIAFARGAGDFNGDGIADIIGSFYSESPSLLGYVIFGSKEVFPTQFCLENLNGTNGFVFLNSNSLISTAGGSSIGDVNGDGINDVTITTGGLFSTSSFGYVIFGSKNEFPAQFNLSSINGSNGFVIYANSSYPNPNVDWNTVTGAGDINNDGLDDIVVGTIIDDNVGINGGAYIIYGNNSLPAQINLPDLEGKNGFAITGIYNSDGPCFRLSVDGIGDINNDKIDDIAIAGNCGPIEVHSAYVIFGNENKFPAMFNVSNINGINGFTINGAVFDIDNALVNKVRDVNGDDVDDIIIGGAGPNYVIYGNVKGFPAQFNLSSLDGSNGFTINVNNYISYPQGAGDVNGDGINDMIIGVGYVFENVSKSYVIYGESNSPEFYN